MLSLADKRVERKLEFVKRCRFAREKLNVVDREQIQITVLLTKDGQTTIVSKRPNKQTRKLLRRQIHASLLTKPPPIEIRHRFQQVTLPSSRRTMNQKRRELVRRFGYLFYAGAGDSIG